MAEKPPSRSGNPNLNINPPPPALSTNTPFTPRSTTFPDATDSDPEFDVFDPTPLHSPGGPQYDDLPPTYDEAQQQARAGVAALDPDHLEVHRMVLGEHEHEQPPGQAPPPGHLLSNPHAYEFEPENRRNANGLGMSVPVQHVSASEQVPVGRVSNGSVPAVDPVSTLLQGALQFTHHEPDADVQYAPRLSQPVAVPQENGSSRGQTHYHGPGRHRGCGRRGRGRDRPEIGRIPGQWPTQTSSESLGTFSGREEQSVQFLRAYAKALHAHSIRPAEFADFVDGLNVLCDATDTTSHDLAYGRSDVEGPASIIHNYIRSANEAFFAPRGLKVSLRSLPALVDALKIPDARGQRSGALASALDVVSTPAQKAKALHPWIAQLEIDLPGPSSQTLLLQEMGNRFRHGPETVSRTSTGTNSNAPEKAGLEREEFDPPHSIPEPYESNWNGGRHGPHRGGMGPGRHPWGGRGGRGGRGGFGWGGPGGRGSINGNAGSPDFQAFGQNMGKWGENFGRMMGEWGQQFGRQAEQWGQDMGRRAETFGDEVAARASGSYSQSGQASQPSAASASFSGPQGQETGVHREDSSTSVLTTEALAKHERKEKNKDKGKLKKKAHKEDRTEEHDKSDDDDDDDASSISSSSSSSSSESDDEDPAAAEKLFVQRIREINQAAETSRAKGKKSPESIAREREIAIEKAQSQRTAFQVKIEQKREKRARKREFRQKKRELRREHMQRKRELKGFGKNKERKQYMKEWRERKKELRTAKKEARREWRESKWERKRLRREGHNGEWKQGGDDMVWIVVENLGS